MKADRAQIERALDAPPAAIRAFLLHGGDEAGSRALDARLRTALGADAERVDLTGAQLRGDPGRLANEAASLSLFGAPRYIRVEPAGEEAGEALDLLLAAAVTTHTAVLIAGTLRKDSKLLQRAMVAQAMLAFESRVPEGNAADRLVTTMAREFGLDVDPSTARRLAGAAGNDRAVIARELEKIALYLDAQPGSAREVTHDVLDLLLADAAEGDLANVVNAAMDGEPDALAIELGRVPLASMAVPLARAMLRRTMLLVENAAGGGRGGPNWGFEAKAIERERNRWGANDLDQLLARLVTIERQLKGGGAAGGVMLEDALFRAAHKARRAR